jgi:hypothetical protein
MSTIRCPKCKLINNENVHSCRRCGARLSAGSGRNGGGSKPARASRAVRYWAILFIAAVAVLCLYGFHRQSKGASSPKAETTVENTGNLATGAVPASVPANRELELVKNLNRDFLAQLDRNVADRNGVGLDKNQALALNMMSSLREQRNRKADPAAQKYLDQFSSLVEKYYDQVVRFNQESNRLTKTRYRITSDIAQVQGDASLSAENKDSRQADLLNKLDVESKERSVLARDMSGTLKSLRSLAASGAGSS